jgi:hypothetical protein
VKWRKQMTAMWDDEKVSRLVSGGGIDGLAAFGMYCRVLDIVAAQMDSGSSQCAVTYSVSRWSLLLSLRGSHVRHWFEKLALTHLVTAEWTGSEIRVTIPKLLKYRDEYSKKSGHFPENVPPRTEQKENRTEGEQKDVYTPSPKNGSGTAHGSRFDLTELPPEWREWAAKELCWAAARAEKTFAVFGDYWRAVAGAKGRKADWLGTWRNWCRREDGAPSEPGRLPFPPKREGVADSVMTLVRQRIARGEDPL